MPDNNKIALPEDMELDGDEQGDDDDDDHDDDHDDGDDDGDDNDDNDDDDGVNKLDEGEQDEAIKKRRRLCARQKGYV